MLALIRGWLALGLIVIAMPFFLAGTVGLLRFPDACTRIHAVTKADNVGLGLLVTGLILRNWSPAVGAELLLIWTLVLSAGATAGHLVGALALGRRNPEPAGAAARPTPIPKERQP
ncbi:monovalent cation/H(+) antiporter subunit G [Desulfurivibrio sp. D14AmB]|uniref:monovalent cation/H(+) antiporter subunit G n=1 Tax=Desulfurivibrio sp. D14AmB TaxID=3374370 RepID=UPI00376F11E1